MWSRPEGTVGIVGITGSAKRPLSLKYYHSETVIQNGSFVKRIPSGSGGQLAPLPRGLTRNKQIWEL